MAEERVPLGPRSNPLYGGSSGSSQASGKTPSWARRTGPASRSSVFSDVASTPPESPARDFGQAYTAPVFEHPGYTVETPGHSDGVAASPYHVSASTYHAPPYDVNTPGQSDQGVNSPFSSAPSSPAHYTYGSDSDTRSQRSSRVAARSRLVHTSMAKIEEEDDDYVDPERERQRMVKQWTCGTWIVLIAVILLVLLGGFIVWGKFEPEAPTYKFVKVEVNQFDIYKNSYDWKGAATPSIYGNVTVYFTAYNPNAHYSMLYDTGLVEIGFHKLVMLSGEINSSRVFPNVTRYFGASAIALNFPLYGAGTSLEAALNKTFLNLTIFARLNARVRIFWKILEPSYPRTLSCSLGYNYTTNSVLNSTCVTAKFKTVPKKPVI